MDCSRCLKEGKKETAEGFYLTPYCFKRKGEPQKYHKRGICKKHKSHGGSKITWFK